MDFCDPCLLLKTHVKAKFQCTNCEEKYCDHCKEDHIKFGLFRNHIVRVLEEKQVYDYAYTDSLQRTTSVLNDGPSQKGSTRDTSMSTLQTDSSLTSRRTSGFVVVGQGRTQNQPVKQKEAAAVYDNASISGQLLSSPTRLSGRHNSNQSKTSGFVAAGQWRSQNQSVQQKETAPVYDNALISGQWLSSPTRPRERQNSNKNTTSGFVAVSKAQTSSVSSGFVFVGTRPCHTANDDIRTIEEIILRSNVLHDHAKQENKSNNNTSTNGEFTVCKHAIACSYSQATHKNDTRLSSVSEMDKNGLKSPHIMSEVNCTKSSEQADTTGSNITSSSKGISKGTKGQRLEEETDAMVYDSDTINDICHRHGRKSEQLRLQCKKVSREIKSVSPLIQCVWPGYRLLEPEKVVFVVFTEHREQIELPHHLQSLDIMFDIKSPSSEDKDVVTSDDVKRKGFTDNELNDLSTTLESKTDELLDKHKRLSIISACPVKSKRYGTPEAEIVNQTCIVLYVRVKGIIPLKEDQFPTEINGISTDVREGSFSFFGKSPKDYHETLKVGCQISRKESCFGTLGPFVMDKQNNVCSITSAHVLLSDCQYKWLQGVGEIDYTSDIISSYHPLPTVANSNFGHVSKGVIKSGGNGEAGIEVVLVKITNAGKIPNSITFPEFPIENIEAAGFQSFPTFTGLSYDGLARGLVYLKFGCETNITRGKFYFSGAIVKLDSYPYTKLHKQIQILSDCSQQFAKHGDSGSLVAIGYNGELVDLRAIGIVTGGVLTSEVTFVTPMKDILTALDCSLLKFPEGMDTSN